MLAFLLMSADLLYGFLIKVLLLLVGVRVVFVLRVNRISVLVVHHFILVLLLFFFSHVIFLTVLLIEFVLLNHLLKMLVDKFAGQKAANQSLHLDNCAHCALVDFDDDRALFVFFFLFLVILLSRAFLLALLLLLPHHVLLLGLNLPLQLKCALLLNLCSLIRKVQLLLSGGFAHRHLKVRLVHSLSNWLVLRSIVVDSVMVADLLCLVLGHEARIDTRVRWRVHWF
jgi:hypothetical protein